MKKNLNSEINSSSTLGTTTINQSQQSAISSSSVSNKTYKEQSELIDNFIKYCNEGNAQKAYELLSANCKEVMFPTLEYFINNYVKVVFSENRIYSIKNWTGSTYKVSITENILATGKYNNGVAIEDYFTIVTENGKNRLNINSFISRTSSTKKASNNGLDLEVLYKDTYMDYVIFTVKASNKTDKIISLDSGKSTQNMYIVDNNSVKYLSARNEILGANLRVLPNSENTVEIKYYSSYVSTKTINSMIFNDIILDLSTYESTNSKEDYTGRISIKIEL